MQERKQKVGLKPQSDVTFVVVTAPVELNTLDDVTLFMAIAPQGAKAVYHRGYLPKDRALQTLDLIASVLYGHTIAGHIQLVQRRLGFKEYEYIAIRATSNKRASDRLAAWEWNPS